MKAGRRTRAASPSPEHRSAAPSTASGPSRRWRAASRNPLATATPTPLDVPESMVVRGPATRRVPRVDTADSHPVRHNARMAIEFSERVRRLPVYPVAGAYDLGDDVAMLASNESPDPPLQAVVAAAQRAVAGANRYPDPSNSALRGALSKRYGVPVARIARSEEHT